jgi:hypothetical protein
LKGERARHLNEPFCERMVSRCERFKEASVRALKAQDALGAIVKVSDADHLSEVQAQSATQSWSEKSGQSPVIGNFRLKPEPDKPQHPIITFLACRRVSVQV